MMVTAICYCEYDISDTGGSIDDDHVSGGGHGVDSDREVMMTVTEGGWLPYEDDDGGGLCHGADHAAAAHHRQEGEERPLAVWALALPWHGRARGATATRDAPAAH